MTTLVIADNAPDFLETRREFLEGEGYEVIAAASVAEAQTALGRGGIDLAVLDLRLENDEDDKDLSGLNLAKDPAYRAIPKIIQTDYPSVQVVRAALRPQNNGAAAAIDFVTKDEGPGALIASVRRSIAVNIEKHPKQVLLNVSELLEKDYEEARKQSFFTHRVRLMMFVLGGIVMILGGIAILLLDHKTEGAFGAVSGAVVQGLALLFSKFSEDANRRVDKCRKELLELYKTQKYEQQGDTNERSNSHC